LQQKTQNNSVDFRRKFIKKCYAV